MRIAILSNVNMDMLIQQTSKNHVMFQVEGYGQWVNYALSIDSNLTKFSPDCILILLDGYAIIENLDNKSIDKEFKQYAYFIEQLAINYSSATIAVSNIHINNRRIDAGDSIEPLNAVETLWDEQCKLLIEKIKTIHLFSLREQIIAEGTNNSYDDKMWYMGSIPYSLKFIKRLSIIIDEFMKKLTMKRKKVFVTDLDNTLWGGVVGEDGVQGITLSESLVGAAYRDTQKLIKQMKDKGVILAIVSKNNEDDVREVFTKNSHMILKQEDFAASRINWESKAQNIKSIAKELNLSLESFVFFDDNNIEQEIIRQELPEVTVVEFPKDIAKLPETVQKTYKEFFFEWRITEEDKLRTIQYREEAERRREFSSVDAGVVSLDDYLHQLEIIITLDTVNEQNIERVVQLLNKTNQFNTNTVRIDLKGMVQYIEKPEHRVYVASVKDKYGDSGLIAVVMIAVAGEQAIIQNFLMSCRVMGRHIEDAIIRAIEEQLLRDGVYTVIASYIPTSKNSPVKDLWQKLGYIESSCDNDIIMYSKNLSLSQKPTVLTANWVITQEAE